VRPNSVNSTELNLFKALQCFLMAWSRSAYPNTAATSIPANHGPSAFMPARTLAPRKSNGLRAFDASSAAVSSGSSAFGCFGAAAGFGDRGGVMRITSPLG
jgi:hypothetical protein